MTDVLLGLQRDFPGYRIWQESHGERKRFVACRIVASASVRCERKPGADNDIGGGIIEEVTKAQRH